MLVIALTLGACFFPQPDTNDTSTPNTGQNPSDTPSTAPKTAKEAIDEYLANLGDNYTISGEIKNNLGEVLKGGQKYKLLSDGNKVYGSNDGELYYIEKNPDGSSYVYTKENSSWRKRPVTDDDDYTTDISTLTDLLNKVTWQSYNASTRVAEGKSKMKSNNLWIKCTLRSDGATVLIYKIQHMWLVGDTLISVGNIDLYDIGSTTVTLPTNVIA